DFSLSSDASWSRRVRQSADVVSSRMGDTGVLVHLRTNRIFEVNATGLRIWELAADGRTLLDIKETLQREFEVDTDRLEAELLALVAELTREGILDDDNPQ
ncbi:MAG: PqqD family protein, partial [Vicinamibacterales bacterium]